MPRRAKNFHGLLQAEMIALIRQRLDYLNMPVAELARLLDTSYSSVRRTLHDAGGDRATTVALLESYATALDMEFDVRLVRRKKR